MADKKKWIPKDLKKGALHRDLGVPLDKPIPPGRVAEAAKGGGKTAQRARLALTFAKMRAKGKVARNRGK